MIIKKIFALSLASMLTAGGIMVTHTPVQAIEQAKEESVEFVHKHKKYRRRSCKKYFWKKVGYRYNSRRRSYYYYFHGFKYLHKYNGHIYKYTYYWRKC